MRMGLMNGKTCSQEEVAQQLGISVERVKQIERKPFRHIRKRNYPESVNNDAAEEPLD